MTFQEFKANVEQWAQDRGIYEHSTALAQCLKAVSELGELADHAIKGDRDAMRDDIGDIAVCLVNVARMDGFKVVLEDTHENIMPEDLQVCVAVLADVIGGIASGFTPWSTGYPSDRIEGAFNALRDIAERAGFTFEECCAHAWNEIKDRKGRMVPGGAFVKEQQQMTKTTSDGTTASYYQLPEGCTELQDLISYRNMNAQDGEIFRAIYRKGRASHSDELRDARKVLFYAQAEVERLEKLHKPIINEPYTAHPATPNVWEVGEQLSGTDSRHIQRDNE